jgi:hypothetical protein
LSVDDLLQAVTRVETALRQLSEDLASAGQARYSVRSEDLAEELNRARRAAMRGHSEVRRMDKTEPNLEAHAARARDKTKRG